MRTTNRDIETAKKLDLDELFRKVQRDDAEAFRVLYDHLSKRVHAYCLSFTRNEDISKDLFHNAMIKVYEKRNRYVEGNLLGWIFTIVRNVCRSWEHHNKRYEPLGEAIDVPDEVERSLDDDELQEINRAILRLPEEFRSVILLHYYGEMQVNDIAVLQGISESLVKIRLYRARKKLEEQLKHISVSTL